MIEICLAGVSTGRVEDVSRVVREGSPGTLDRTGFPCGRWRRTGTDSAIERLDREVRGRTRAAGTFHDGRSALMLVAARLKYVVESE